MQIQSTQNYNSYQNPNFQKSIVKPVKDKFGNIKPLCGLERTIRENKSIQEYAKSLEEQSRQFGKPVVDLIVEYGESMAQFGRECVSMRTSDGKSSMIIADEGVCTDKRSIYKQMETFDCSHITKSIKENYNLQNGLMQNYLA